MVFSQVYQTIYHRYIKERTCQIKEGICLSHRYIKKSLIGISKRYQTDAERGGLDVLGLLPPLAQQALERRGGRRRLRRPVARLCLSGRQSRPNKTVNIRQSRSYKTVKTHIRRSMAHIRQTRPDYGAPCAAGPRGSRRPPSSAPPSRAPVRTCGFRVRKLDRPWPCTFEVRGHSSEYGTHKTGKARFWPWLPGERHCTLFRCFLYAWKRMSADASPQAGICAAQSHTKKQNIFVYTKIN